MLDVFIISVIYLFRQQGNQAYNGGKMENEVSIPSISFWSERSEQLDKLAPALCKAQGIIEAASKNAENPHFRKKYADIGAIWDAVRKPITDNGLCIIQEPQSANGKVVLVTTLLHSSGQYIRSSISMPVVKQDPQGYGSAITYARRYSLQSIVGISAEDDDGNAASQPQPARPAPQAKPAAPAPKPAPQPTVKKPEPPVDLMYDFNGLPEDKKETAIAMAVQQGAVQVSETVYSSKATLKPTASFAKCLIKVTEV